MDKSYISHCWNATKKELYEMQLKKNDMYFFRFSPKRGVVKCYHLKPVDILEMQIHQKKEGD
jgi:hypothetical protein